MISRNKIIYLAPFILCFFISSRVGKSVKLETSCDEETVYDTITTSGRLYQSNVRSLFSVLASNASQAPNGFYNYTAGGGSGGALVYGLFLCRGDQTALECKSCLESAAKELLGSCSNVTRAVTWYDECMLRYSDLPIISKLMTSPSWCVRDTTNVSDGELLSRVVEETFNRITTRAVKVEPDDVSGKKYAVGEANFTENGKIFALVQCTPDLTNLDCENCLRGGIASLSTSCCTDRTACGILYPSCYIRYSISPFYQAAAPPPPQLSPPSSAHDRGTSSTTKIVYIVSPITAAAIAFVVVIVCLAKKITRRSHNVAPKTSVVSNISTDGESLRYNFSQVQVYTNNFADENIIGKGGYGPVYKGTLPNGQIIAVKRLSINSTQGEKEFINEITLVAKLQHRNLVRLLGYCLEGEEKILIYEFVTNKSLDYFLFDPEKQPLMDWLTRFNIIKGISRGLLYIHEDSRIKIIHCDLKAGNVLLDQDMNAKIADFGIAKLFELGQSERNTTKIAGTFGYMAPEYVSEGTLSVKSDVFSFGVLLLEIISGKMNSNKQFFGGVNLRTYAWKQWRDGTPLAMTDSAIQKSLDKNEVIRCIQIGLLCVEENVDKRPTMASIVMMLNSKSVPLPTLNTPAFFGRNESGDLSREIPVILHSDDSSSSYSEASQNETLSKDLYSR